MTASGLSSYVNELQHPLMLLQTGSAKKAPAFTRGQFQSPEASYRLNSDKKKESEHIYGKASQRNEPEFTGERRLESDKDHHTGSLSHKSLTSS